MNTHTHEYSGLHISVHAYTHTQYRIVYSSPLHTYTCGCMYVQRNNTEYSSHTYMHRHTNRIANMNAGMFTHTPHTSIRRCRAVQFQGFTCCHCLLTGIKLFSCKHWCCVYGNHSTLHTARPVCCTSQFYDSFFLPLLISLRYVKWMPSALKSWRSLQKMHIIEGSGLPITGRLQPIRMSQKYAWKTQRVATTFFSQAAA